MKSDRITVQKRVEEVLQLRLLGALFHDIRQHASEQGWSVGERQLRRYLAEADDLIAASIDRDRERNLNLHLARRHALYARAMSVSDHRTALAVDRDAADLLGLYPPKRIEASGPGGGPIPTATVELTDDERARAVAALLARLGTPVPRPHPDGTADPGRLALGTAGTADATGRNGTGPLADGPSPLF